MSQFRSYHYLSEGDLSKLDFWTSDYPEKNKKEFEEMMFKYGADINYKIEVVEDTHRLRTSKNEYTGKRFVFVERTDRGWLNSGLATIEAYMAASDPEIQKDIDGMRGYTKLPQKKDVEE